ncbi:hypothetical protein [Pseudodesulfovibrio nedwellii]|nr:hypothetical protein [Pseudodesulfovibrio nedwellii]
MEILSVMASMSIAIITAPLKKISQQTTDTNKAAGTLMPLP